MLNTESTNGIHKAAQDLQELLAIPQELEPKAPKKRSNRNNKFQDIQIDIDAGARFVKASVNDNFITYPSIYRVVDSALPKNKPGCFTFDGINYATGTSANSEEGELHTAANNNKIEKIHLWLLGALTHDRRLLTQLHESKRRKNEPSRLKLNIRMLTLSSAMENEIIESLASVKKFIWEGKEYEVQLGKWESLPEGFGSALAATHLNPEMEKFHILDCGGGTLTLTSYSVIHHGSGLTEPCPNESMIANGGGISGIIEAIHIGLSKTDKSGARIVPELIQEALKSSTAKSVEYLFGNKPKNIIKSVHSALNDWIQENPQVNRILTFTIAALLRKEPVFLSGGGFASDAICEWVSNYLTKNVPDAPLYRLENSHQVNVTGLVALPPLVPPAKPRSSKKKNADNGDAQTK